MREPGAPGPMRSDTGLSSDRMISNPNPILHGSSCRKRGLAADGEMNQSRAIVPVT